MYAPGPHNTNSSPSALRALVLLPVQPSPHRPVLRYAVAPVYPSLTCHGIPTMPYRSTVLAAWSTSASGDADAACDHMLSTLPWHDCCAEFSSADFRCAWLLARSSRRSRASLSEQYAAWSKALLSGPAGWALKASKSIATARQREAPDSPSAWGNVCVHLARCQ